MWNTGSACTVSFLSSYHDFLKEYSFNYIGANELSLWTLTGRRGHCKRQHEDRNRERSKGGGRWREAKGEGGRGGRKRGIREISFQYPRSYPRIPCGTVLSQTHWWLWHLKDPQFCLEPRVLQAGTQWQSSHFNISQNCGQIIPGRTWPVNCQGSSSD
jgi:hypothetical protein